MEPKFSPGQAVRIIPLIDGIGRHDPELKRFAGCTGTVQRVYYLSKEEIWEKVLRLEDIYCYDVRLDGSGDVVHGIPEVGLEAVSPLRN
ncbi:MAG: hypothetical protein N2506_03220 [Dehalococcoidales bacterium]|nr:hypothetical protein [Dehalococcoidales bacterium]